MLVWETSVAREAVVILDSILTYAVSWYLYHITIYNILQVALNILAILLTIIIFTYLFPCPHSSIRGAIHNPHESCLVDAY